MIIAKVNRNVNAIPHFFFPFICREICDLADKHEAMVFIDECHATGFFGPTGRYVTNSIDASLLHASYKIRENVGLFFFLSPKAECMHQAYMLSIICN